MDDADLRHFPCTDEIVWITVGILVALFAIQRFGTDKVGYLFAPVILLWLLLIGGVGVYNLIKYDTGALRAFNLKYIIDYFRRNKKKGWVSLGGILLCFTGMPPRCGLKSSVRIESRLKSMDRKIYTCILRILCKSRRHRSPFF